jgi:hypothetical protein
MVGERKKSAEWAKFHLVIKLTWWENFPKEWEE